MHLRFEIPRILALSGGVDFGGVYTEEELAWLDDMAEVAAGRLPETHPHHGIPIWGGGEVSGPSFALSIVDVGRYYSPPPPPPLSPPMQPSPSPPSPPSHPPLESPLPLEPPLLADGLSDRPFDIFRGGDNHGSHKLQHAWEAGGLG